MSPVSSLRPKCMHAELLTFRFCFPQKPYYLELIDEFFPNKVIKW